ncbi:unnamed protein product [Adineta steineri]|uniref:Cytidyltransferase-like domain-containing protein n=1 Tax=Adineta steineri TaxID=433720 RepID=A0A814L8M4_9BILA|nr:unnamed protein product [Adineta steineri]CAF1059988.1 unnamed protein product [Adineta steineri]
MHTRKNTNIDIIVENCKKIGAEDKDNNCVLIITGSLNPIHRSHIANLQLVRRYFEHHKERPLNVLAAYLSPTHDGYVKNKLGSSHWIPAVDRSKLCQEVIKEENLESLISVAEGEFQYKRFVDFDDVVIELAQFLNDERDKPDGLGLLKKPLKVVYVCGLDHFNNCRHVEQLAKNENIACAVIYRLNASEDYIKRLEEKSSNIYYITLDDERKTLVDISSTKIRKQYQNPTDSEFENLTYSVVNDYLHEKYMKN